MKLTFEAAQVVITTLMLLPAMLALMVYALRYKGGQSEEHWNPQRCPERDWWSEEETP